MTDRANETPQEKFIREGIAFMGYSQGTRSLLPKCWCGGATTVTFNPEGLWSLCCVDSEFHDPTSDGRPEAVEVLYVSGPMSGYPECNYPAFKEAAHRLRLAGYVVVDPSEVTTPGRHHYTDLLKEDIRNLLDCHGVALLDRWWESSGARCEVQVAGITRMPVRTVDEWVRSVDWDPWP